MLKVNLTTLAYNAARARQRLTRQETKLKKLTTQLIDRVGTGGQTITTNLGLVVVTAETQDRIDRGFLIVFNEDAFLNLEPDKQAELVKLGIIKTEKKVIKGQTPKVQFRLTEKM